MVEDSPVSVTGLPQVDYTKIDYTISTYCTSVVITWTNLVLSLQRAIDLFHPCFCTLDAMIQAHKAIPLIRTAFLLLSVLQTKTSAIGSLASHGIRRTFGMIMRFRAHRRVITWVCLFIIPLFIHKGHKGYEWQKQMFILAVVEGWGSNQAEIYVHLLRSS